MDVSSLLGGIAPSLSLPSLCPYSHLVVFVYVFLCCFIYYQIHHFLFIIIGLHIINILSPLLVPFLCHSDKLMCRLS